MALVFPGQGTQYRGMARDLARDFESAREVCRRIGNGFRTVDPEFDIAAQLDSDDDFDRAPPDRGQALVFAHSAMALWALREAMADVPFSSVASVGHSFGEMAAHLAAGTLDVTAMSALVLERGRCMLTGPEGAMLNVERLTRDELLEMIDAFPGDCVHLAISHSKLLHAVGGGPAAVDAFADFLRARGVPCRRITGVHRALHTPLQSHARARFETALAARSFGRPRFPVISTTHGRMHEAGRAAAELAAQFDQEMRFDLAIECVASIKPDLYLVFGPGAKTAELLSYNNIPAERVRVVDRSYQIRAVAAELGASPAVVQIVPRRSATRLLRDFARGEADYLLFEPGGGVSLLADALERSSVLILLKGSFNPIHVAHIAIFNATMRRHPGAFAAFALSVDTHKRTLAVRELLFRARLIVASGYPVVLSHSGFFYENVAWVRARAPGMRIVFAVGSDAMQRLIDYFSADDFAAHFRGVVFDVPTRHRQPAWPSHPAYAGIRPLDIDARVASLSSTAIRAAGRVGDIAFIRAAVPADASDAFLRRRGLWFHS